MFWRTPSDPTVANLPQGGVTASATEGERERAGRRLPSVPDVTLRFRGREWHLVEAGADRQRFVRAHVVAGAIVESEVQVLASDLDPQPDGTVILRGR